LGTDFVADVFRWANESDPQAKLMFNESRFVQLDNPLFTKVSETTIELLRKLKQNSSPVHLVGEHFHSWIYDPPNFQIVRQIIKTIKDMGYDFWASEVTVNLANRDPLATMRKKSVEINGDLLQAQAQFYKELLQLVLDNNGGFIMFGFSDNHPFFARDLNLPDARAHIYDENYKPKPAYYAVYDVLQKASMKKTA
jgi:endo-1,4-beta-xylanase